MTNGRGPATFTSSEITLTELAARLDASLPRVSTVRREWFDTFDWSLWSRGMVLEVDRPATSRARSRRRQATLRGRDDNAVAWTTPLDHEHERVPVLREDLPDGPWRRSLDPVLGIRALLPLAGARVKAAVVEMRDRQGKVLAEALWEESVPLDDDGKVIGDAVRFVRVVPLRGYEAAADRLCATLLGAGMVASEHPLAAATAARGDGRRAGVDPARVQAAIEPDMPAVEANGVMLASLAATMRVIEPWLGEPPDTEFLHDYRVALRRSRSVLKQADGIIAAAPLAAWRASLRDFQQRTNHARDLDVFLLEFAEYRTMVPAGFAADLDALHALIASQRVDEQRRLRSYFRSRAYGRLREQYDEFVDGPPWDGEREATRPASDIGADRIRRAHRRVLKRGRAVSPSSPPAAVHDVRIAAKELRYLLELYGELYDPKPLKAFIRALKALQDNLGEFQDSEVHAAALMGFAEQLTASKDTTARALMAVGLLAEAFTQRQAGARDDFAERFESFAAWASRDRIDGLLAT